MIQDLLSLLSLLSLSGIVKKPTQCLEIILTSLAFPNNTSDAQVADVPLIVTTVLGGVNNVQIPHLFTTCGKTALGWVYDSRACWMWPHLSLSERSPFVSIAGDMGRKEGM